MLNAICDKCLRDIETFHSLGAVLCQCEVCGKETTCRCVTVYQLKQAPKYDGVILPFEASHVKAKVASR